MNLRALAAACGLGFALLQSAVGASNFDTRPLRYHWTPGQTLRYLIQCDPYFADPAAAIETTDPHSPYRPPRVERLTERVVRVEADGTATLRLTLTPEPGFEDITNPQTPVTQTVTVSPAGDVISEAPERLAPEMQAAFFRLPVTPISGHSGLSVMTWIGPLNMTQNNSPGHDGILVQTTRSRRQDRVVFDVRSGRLVRRTGIITGSLSLVMLRPAGRGADDFGRVVPTLPISQTLTIERKDDMLSARGIP